MEEAAWDCYSRNSLGATSAVLHVQHIMDIGFFFNVMQL